MLEPSSTRRIIGALQTMTTVMVAWVASFFGSMFLGSLSFVGGPLAAAVVLAPALRSPKATALVTAAVAGTTALAADYATSPGFVTQPAAAASSLVQLDATLAAVVGTLMGALAGALAGRLAASPESHQAKSNVLAAAVLAIVILGTFSYASSVQPGAASDGVAEAGSYAYDADIYKQAHHLMIERGLGYYDALVVAAAGDSRLMAEGAVVDGKFTAWATSPSYIRLPFIFWVWRAANAIGVDVFALAMACAGVLLAGTYWAFRPQFEQSALAIPLILYPWFIAHTTSGNLYFPDMWAAMFALGSMLLVVREKWLLAGVLALAAALCREVAAIWLVFLVLSAAVAAAGGQDRSARRDLLVYAAMLGAFVLAVWLHRSPASAMIAQGTVVFSATEILVRSAGGALTDKFLVPSAYMMYFYGSDYLPVAVLTLLAPFGFVLGTQRSSRRSRVTLLAASVFWPVFLLTIGATSDYWGQQYTAFVLVGCAALALALAGATSTDSRVLNQIWTEPESQRST